MRMLYCSRCKTYAHLCVCVDSAWFVLCADTHFVRLVPSKPHLALIKLNKVSVGEHVGGMAEIRQQLVVDKEFPK